VKIMALLAALLLLSISVYAQETLDCEAGYRPVEHALGSTCVPEQPQRVFTLDMTVLELLLIAEMQPAAFSGTLLDAYLRMHPELEGSFDHLRETSIDVGFPPNAESILSAQLDVILVPRDLFTESLYPQLAEVAPTVVYEPVPGQWRERLIFAGEVLGLSDLVETLLADYDARLDALREILGDAAGEIDLSLVRTFPDQIGLILEGTAAAALLNEAGLSRPESQAYDYDYVLSELEGRPELLISEEELLLADGDVIFVFGDPTHLAENPLWNALPAVRDGRAFEVGYYWWGDSLLSTHDMLDDLFQYVTEVQPALSNPFETSISTNADREATAEVTDTP